MTPIILKEKQLSMYAIKENEIKPLACYQGIHIKKTNSFRLGRV